MLTLVEWKWGVSLWTIIFQYFCFSINHRSWKLKLRVLDLPGLRSIGCLHAFWCWRNKWSNIAPYSSWMRCISLICSATFSIPFKASERDHPIKFLLLQIRKGWINLPRRCWCSSDRWSVKFLSDCSNRGYFRMRWMGLMRYDSRLRLCCLLGFLSAR